MNTRPLGQLSDFAVEILPAELETSSPELVCRCEALVAALSTDFIAQVVKSGGCDLAALDVKMIEAGLVHSGLTPPSSLTKLVDQLSGGELPVLTYEELVLLNPAADLRTFTRGKVGRTEANFYQQHRCIESYLERAIMKVHRALEALSLNMASARDPDVPGAIQALAGIDSDLMPVIVSTAELAQMPAGDFTAFRKYLNSHPLRNTKGPSGTFTARIPLLELLLRGDELPAEYMKYLDVNWQYFPRQGRTEITEALARVRSGNTLVSLWRQLGESAELAKGLAVIGEFFNQFRRTHYRAVARQIPDAISGQLAGTGGEANPGVFLRERIKTTHFPKGEK